MKKYITLLLSALAFLVMILDAQTAISGAKEGLSLCIHTVIPSLFPFFVLSSLLTSALSAFHFQVLRPLGMLCRIPRGSESLLILGLLGGYPSGAQNIAQCYAAGALSKKDARRMLGFCSNAGPAFLFGIVASQFPTVYYAWALWGIHISSAILTGMLVSGKAHCEGTVIRGKQLSLPDALPVALQGTARVCGWVILFRVLTGFLAKWTELFLPSSVFTVISGLMELSIGCCNLKMIDNMGQRFVICAVLLGFGGMCVMMQTASVTGELGLGAYIPGKILQAALSFQLAYQVQLLLLPSQMRMHLPLWVIFGIWFSLLTVKITVAIRRIMMYNPNKSRNKRFCLCFSAKTSPKPATTAPMAPAMRRA